VLRSWLSRNATPSWERRGWSMTHPQPKTKKYFTPTFEVMTTKPPAQIFCLFLRGSAENGRNSPNTGVPSLQHHTQEDLRL
jgi:hypothetical protein